MKQTWRRQRRASAKRFYNLSLSHKMRQVIRERGGREGGGMEEGCASIWQSASGVINMADIAQRSPGNFSYLYKVRSALSCLPLLPLSSSPFSSPLSPSLCFMTHFGMLTPAAAHTECTLWEFCPTHLAKTHLNYSWAWAAHTAYVRIAYTSRVCVCWLRLP